VEHVPQRHQKLVAPQLRQGVVLATATGARARTDTKQAVSLASRHLLVAKREN
jgi:aspartyl aminopeptidase